MSLLARPLQVLKRGMRAGMGSLSVLYAPPPRAAARIAYGPGPLHFGDLRLPDGAGPHPVVVNVHGGFWRARYDLTHAGHLCAALAAAGVATWNIEYGRIGNEGGAWPGTFEDVGRALDSLRVLAPQYNLDLARVVVMGHSAGGQLALWMAARPTFAPDSPFYHPNPLRVRAALSLAGVVDLRRAWELGLSDHVVGELLGGSPDEQPARYAAASPIELLPLGIPQRLIHGTADSIVPFDLSRRYQQAALARGDSCTLLPLPGADHFEAIDPLAKEWQSVQGAVLAALGGA